MTSAPTMTPLRLRLVEARFIESGEVDYHAFLAWRWHQIDLASENIQAQRAHRQVVEFGRSAANPEYAAGAWLLVALAWFALFIITISRGMLR